MTPESQFGKTDENSQRIWSFCELSFFVELITVYFVIITKRIIKGVDSLRRRVSLTFEMFGLNILVSDIKLIEYQLTKINLPSSIFLLTFITTNCGIYVRLGQF